MPRFALVAAALAISLTADAGDENVWSFTCGDVTVNATFNAPDDVTLVIGDKTYENVPQVMSGSGARYEMGEAADYVMFWDSGETAILQLGTTEYPECTREAS
jgi:membrane-bound inhibitor of C-type lysozyme